MGFDARDTRTPRPLRTRHAHTTTPPPLARFPPAGLDTVSAGNVQIKKDTNTSLAGKHVLLVDEMCDSGQTMASLVQLMRDRGALSVRSCVMFDKHARRASDLSPDLVGLVCPDEFVVGYGMDWANRFRSLPDVCVVRREAYAGK